MDEVERLCDDIALIDKGTIIEKGSLSQLLQKYSKTSVYVKGNITKNTLDSFGSVQTKNDGFIVLTSDPLTTLKRLIDYFCDHSIFPDQLELARPKLEEYGWNRLCRYLYLCCAYLFNDI
ncbi:hypothetical protein GCM10008986_00230 [Salinibacillus aidingensis]|uniref:Uncharacterized protein n=1 Tax=Salinibacillus aidingensis TaxID=237684 RepID=A0ABN1ALW3_9BACI